MMLRICDLIDQHVGEFAYLEAISMGKPVSNYVDHIIGNSILRCKQRVVRLYRRHTCTVVDVLTSSQITLGRVTISRVLPRWPRIAI